jgi:hypothetical protein
VGGFCIWDAATSQRVAVVGDSRLSSVDGAEAQHVNPSLTRGSLPLISRRKVYTTVLAVATPPYSAPSVASSFASSPSSYLPLPHHDDTSIETSPGEPRGASVRASQIAPLHNRTSRQSLLAPASRSRGQSRSPFFADRGS